MKGEGKYILGEAALETEMAARVCWQRLSFLLIARREAAFCLSLHFIVFSLFHCIFSIPLPSLPHYVPRSQ